MKSWNILACFYICMFAANAATTFCNPMSIPDTPVGILCRDCRDGDMWRGFVDPPDSAKPWCYWWWVNGHVDRETITADLESMKRLGFGGILMFDSRGYWDDADHVVNPKAEIVWGSPEWYDLVEFSVRECARLGLVGQVVLKEKSDT